jgi:hypothetical protein
MARIAWTCAAIALTPVAALLVTAPSNAGDDAARPVLTQSASASASATPSTSASVLPPSTTTETEQVVWLHSGVVLRGQIVEMDPGNKLVLQLATGEIRQLPWTQIARTSSVHSPTSPSPSSSPAASPDPSVVFYIRSSAPGLFLETRSRFGPGQRWQRACDAPCNKPVAVEDQDLRVNGPGINPSNPFHVVGDSAAAKLIVSPGQQWKQTWGTATLVTGLGLAFASGLLYGGGKLQDQGALVAGGIAGMVLGGAMIVVSVPLLGAGRTTVSTPDGARLGMSSERQISF